MPTPSRGAAPNRPDTSPQAVAAILRLLTNAIVQSVGPLPPLIAQDAANVYALADALEQTPVSDTALLGALTKEPPPADETGPYGYCDCGTPLACPTCRFCDNDD